jgi:PAS domain S-box-containing protein
MIWESPPLMTIVDLAILAAAALALRILYRHRQRFVDGAAMRGAVLMAVGLSVIGVFHLADLFTMFALPSLTSPSAAMAAMESLHLNYSWPTMLVSVLCLLGGFNLTSQQLLALLGDLSRSRSALEKELVRSERTHAALEESEERFQLMAGHINDVFWLTDSGRQIRYLSPAFKRVWGRPVDSQRSSDDWLETIHTDDRNRVGELLKGAIAAGGFDAEYRIVRPDETVRWIRDRGFVISEITTSRYRMAGIAQDVTELKEREEKLQQTQKLESLGVLAGGIAHDFNNLLTGILGQASLVSAKLGRESPARDAVKTIETAALRAADLTNQMLAYSGKATFVIESLDLSALVEEMAQLLTVAISKSASVKLDLDPELPLVEGDPVQLRQVIMNLVTNASEAIGDLDGVISVSTGFVDADRRYLDALAGNPRLQEGRYVFVEVSDTGVGMTEETQARILDPFFTTKFTGRGLGLAAVFGIVRSHQGAIRIDSEPGRGSTFTIVFPVSSDPSRLIESTDDVINAWRGTGTVLVVDDEADVRQVAEEMLETLGFAVEIAEDGRRAVERLRQNPGRIDLVLLDLTMPGPDGAATLRELRRVRADLPAILMSGYVENDAVTGFEDMGIAGFVQKPFRLATLARCVKRVTGG